MSGGETYRLAAHQLLLRRARIAGAQLAEVLLEIRALQLGRAVALDEEDPQPVRQRILSRKQPDRDPISDPREMTLLVLFSQIDEKSSITTNIDKMFPAVPDTDSGDDRIRHKHDVCHTKIIDGCQNPSSPFPWEDGAMGSVPRRPTADDRPDRKSTRLNSSH